MGWCQKASGRLAAHTRRRRLAAVSAGTQVAPAVKTSAVSLRFAKRPPAMGGARTFIGRLCEGEELAFSGREGGKTQEREARWGSCVVCEGVRVFCELP